MLLCSKHSAEGVRDLDMQGRLVPQSIGWHFFTLDTEGRFKYGHLEVTCHICSRGLDFIACLLLEKRTYSYWVPSQLKYKININMFSKRWKIWKPQTLHISSARASKEIMNMKCTEICMHPMSLRWSISLINFSWEISLMVPPVIFRATDDILIHNILSI